MPYYTYFVPVHEICVQIVERIMPVRVCVSIANKGTSPQKWGRPPTDLLQSRVCTSRIGELGFRTVRTSDFL